MVSSGQMGIYMDLPMDHWGCFKDGFKDWGFEAFSRFFLKSFHVETNILTESPILDGILKEQT